MKLKVLVLPEADGGYSVSVPAMPGCHSQGATVPEAMDNIRDAIRDYVELYGEPDVRCQVRELEMAAA